MPTAPTVKLGKNGKKARQAQLTALATNIGLLDAYTVATLPAASANAGRLVRVTNGNAGADTVAMSNGTNWKVVALGATVS